LAKTVFAFAYFLTCE